MKTNGLQISVLKSRMDQLCGKEHTDSRSRTNYSFAGGYENEYQRGGNDSNYGRRCDNNLSGWNDSNSFRSLNYQVSSVRREHSMALFATTERAIKTNQWRNQSLTAANEQEINCKKLLPAGRHIHNELDFLKTSRDLCNTSHSRGGSCFELRVDYDELQRKLFYMGTKPSAVQRQWWNFKSEYFDCILFFKIGAFYNLFNMDADVGVEYIRLNYHKGPIARASFPEKSYAQNLDTLLKLNYKVARIEAIGGGKVEVDFEIVRQFEFEGSQKLQVTEIDPIQYMTRI